MSDYQQGWDDANRYRRERNAAYRQSAWRPVAFLLFMYPTMILMLIGLLLTRHQPFIVSRVVMFGVPSLFALYGAYRVWKLAGTREEKRIRAFKQKWNET